MIALVLIAVALAAAVAVGLRSPRSPAVGGLLLVATLLPIGAVAVASGLAGALGCTVNEAGTTPCPVGGWDAGPVLTDLFVSGWWMLLTLPAGGVLFLVWRLLARRRAA